MDALKIYRRTRARQAARDLGRSGTNPRQLEAQLQADTLEAEILAMPVDADELTMLHRSDGTFKFMVGISAVGGPDKVS